MSFERGVGASLKIRRGQGKEEVHYGGSVHLANASQKNLVMDRQRKIDNQSDKGKHCVLYCRRQDWLTSRLICLIWVGLV